MTGKQQDDSSMARMLFHTSTRRDLVCRIGLAATSPITVAGAAAILAAPSAASASPALTGGSHDPAARATHYQEQGAGTRLFQLHADGSLFRYTGLAGADFVEVDSNPATVQIAIDDSGQLYQRHDNGRVWRYTGTPMTGWEELDNNPASVELAAGGGQLYQRHDNGRIWRFTGTPMTGWEELDNNPATVEIVAGSSGQLYQRHSNGQIWRYTGTPMTGWEELDNNLATVQIEAGNEFYQRHDNGRIWRYTGTPLTGWEELDNNPATVEIVARGDHLCQRHDDGGIWQYTGTPLTGWVELDNNPATIAIAVDAEGQVYQLHDDGEVWQYTGTPLTGWIAVDSNSATVEIVAGSGQLYQRHDNGKIWHFTGSALSDWEQLDSNPATAEIVTGAGELYQRHENGRIWRFTGIPLTGWEELDDNPATVQILARGGELYQRHGNGRIWRYTGTPMTGWEELDNNPATVDIVAGAGKLYQRHDTGRIWQYIGPPLTGWIELDDNPATVQVIADSDGQLYQRHENGRIWRYTGVPHTGWQELDDNPATVDIVAGGGRLYQLQENGRIWEYTGTPMTGWVELDNNPAAVAIEAGSGQLYQRHDDGKIWRYAGTPMAGWEELDTNPDTVAIVSGSTNPGDGMGMAVFSGQIRSGGLAALGGNVEVTIYGNGITRWKGHAHDSGLDGYDFGVVALLDNGSGRLLAFTKNGSVGGTLTSGSRDFDWDTTDIGQTFLVADFDRFANGQFSTQTGYASDIGTTVESVFGALTTWVLGSTPIGAALGLVVFVGVSIGSLLSEGSLVPGARVVGSVLWFAGPSNTLLALAAEGIASEGSKTRELSAGEYDWANGEVFGGSLPPRGQIVLTDTIGGGGRPFVLPRFDGKITINMGPDSYADPRSYNVAHPNPQRVKQYGETFIHELTHVWQIAHTSTTLDFLADALVSRVCEAVGEDPYNYGNAGPDFAEFNLEQQGSIVADWFIGSGTGMAKDPNSPYFRYIRDNIRLGQT